MDRPFILKMSESYYIDFDLNDTSIWSNRENAIFELSGEISKIMENLKLEDMELYEGLFTYNRQKQYEIIYHLLTNYMNEEFSDEVLQSSGLELIEEGFLTTMAIVIASAYMVKPISKYTVKTITGLSKLNDSISTWIRKTTSSQRVNNAILYSDYDDCLKQCGINGKKELSTFVVLSKVTGASINKESHDKAMCLTDCYLSTSVEIVKSLANAYKQCLKASGTDIRDLDSISTVLGHSLNSSCKVFRDKLVTHRGEFDSAIKVIFSKPTDRDLWIKKYEENLISGLKDDKSGFKSKQPYNQSNKSKQSYNQSNKSKQHYKRF